MKTKNLIIVALIVCMGSLSTYATKNSTKTDFKKINAKEVVSYLNFMADTYTEIGHLDNKERLQTLQVRYNLESELLYARSYKIDDKTVKVIMVTKSGEALEVLQDGPEDPENACGCHNGKWDYTPEIPAGEPGWCNKGCQTWGPE